MNTWAQLSPSTFQARKSAWGCICLSWPKFLNLHPHTRIASILSTLSTTHSDWAQAGPVPQRAHSCHSSTPAHPHSHASSCACNSPLRTTILSHPLQKTAPCLQSTACESFRSHKSWGVHQNLCTCHGHLPTRAAPTLSFRLARLSVVLP